MTNKVSYNNLFKLLIDKGLKKKDFAKLCNLSAPTMAKLSKNECFYGCISTNLYRISVSD